MIGKVLRGTDARRLLYYLYGPGKANEHTDPHLVAGFADPAELEPERRPSGAPDLRRLAGLMAQPLAALAIPGYDKPVWHCSVRAAPEDRVLADAEWAQVASAIMHRTGLAPQGDDLGVRWVAVRHAADHVHLVATLARQDGTRPKVWNDFYCVREACQEAERWFGLRRTAPADRTAARRATRAETEQAARRGWGEPPRVTLRREVCTAAAGAAAEQNFFDRLRQSGVLVRLRHSVTTPGEVTGYAVGLPQHTARDGGVIWYGGGKLAPDLTLPKLRTRWASPVECGPTDGTGLSAPAARAVLRSMVTRAAERSPDEPSFFARLRECGVLVRLRFSEADPGQVTGYAVTLPGHPGPDGAPAWYGGGRLAAGLTLPRLREHWRRGRSSSAEHLGTFRFTVPERDAIYAHASRQAAAAAEHIRRCAHGDPAAAADAAWAAADTLHVAARALRSRELRCAADAYDRAARAPHGRLPRHSRDGDQLRRTARLIALTGHATGASTLTAIALVANLIALATAVAELRRAQQHAAQSAAAHAAARHLHAAMTRARPSAPWPGQSERPQRGRSAGVEDVGRQDFPVPLSLGQTPLAAASFPVDTHRHRGRQPPTRAGPGR